MKRYISAMSTDKRTLHYKLFNIAEPLAIHLIRLIQFPEAQAKNHWAKEVYSFLNNVPLLKFSKKLPSAKFIYDEISSYNDVIGNMIMIAKDSELDEQFEGISDEDCLATVDSYQKWLAEELSLKGYVLLDDVKRKLASLKLIDY